jgi:lipopolysaccharide biosynthesis regulator YciM
MLGDLEAQDGNDERAIADWRRIEEVNPPYLSLVAERLMQTYARMGRDEEGRKLVQAYLERRPSADLLHLLFQSVAESRGWQAARQLAAEELKRNPSLRALDDFLQASNAANPEMEQGRVENQLAQDLVHRQVSKDANYLCGNCGFRARQFFWQCPACAHWESIAPERGEHG